MIIVVDTSTIIKGLFKRHTEPTYIVDKIIDGTLQLAMSEEMARELTVTGIIVAEQANKNPKPILRKISSFIFHSNKVNPQVSFPSCSDPDDKMFIECAIEAKVKYVISSDPSIFNVKTYVTNESHLALIEDIEFYHPQAFYQAIQQGLTI
ncbi:putative toxin-antitoxin system toxin component, PIN family [Fictibacillus gelatini]|uniref:putative toxin-antitoxin system toxin component, PIN family n=1 Tax=Fictibacillus gelatini TaxID=225985 RepID=UPI00047DD80E|nr:putative toxin-antitoxin system toxin component, PIN family [Fictibacillus gelatini]